MKISPGIVGATADPRDHEIDARWLMAYAAALGETASEYFDTTRPEGITAHPLFPVCYEWPSAQELRAETLGGDIAVRGVHATHDLTLHRFPSPGDRLLTTAVIAAVEPRPPGTYVLTRFETVDARGQRVSTTEYGSLYRGIECEGKASRPHPHDPLPRRERESEAPSPSDRGQGEGDLLPDWSASVPIAPTLAHVYSECARIWNPIHTDRAVARAAGLPDIILHGTATLALAVSEVLRRGLAGDARSVTRITCRFSAMVRVPSTITVQGSMPTEHVAGRAIRFRVLNAEGRAAVTRGCLVLTR